MYVYIFTYTYDCDLLCAHTCTHRHTGFLLEILRTSMHDSISIRKQIIPEQISQCIVGPRALQKINRNSTPDNHNTLC